MRWVSTSWTWAMHFWSYRHEPEQMRAFAEFYWRALLIMATATIIGSILYGGARFLSILNLEENAGALLSTGGGIPLDRAGLTSVLDDFETRRARYDVLKRTPPAITDPSR